MTAIQTTPVHVERLAPRTAAAMRADVNLIQEIMAEVMKEGEHYGVVTGCKKPSLWKAGAEKLMSTFHIAAEPQVIDLSTGDAIRYRVNVRGTAMESGTFLGMGIGECSSDEEKYKWREAVCDEEFDETPDDRRREKWKKGERAPILQVRTNPADLANTVLKMAKKRAQIDMVLTVTAASDIFGQDIEGPEDLPRGDGSASKPAIKRPTRKARDKTEPLTPGDAPRAAASPDADVEGPDAVLSMSDGDRKRIRGVLAWDAEQRDNRWSMKLASVTGGQPISFSAFDAMPGGLKKGVMIECDVVCKFSGGRAFYNPENLVVI